MLNQEMTHQQFIDFIKENPMSVEFYRYSQGLFTFLFENNEYKIICIYDLRRYRQKDDYEVVSSRKIPIGEDYKSKWMSVSLFLKRKNLGQIKIFNWTR